MPIVRESPTLDDLALLLLGYVPIEPERNAAYYLTLAEEVLCPDEIKLNPTGK